MNAEEFPPNFKAISLLAVLITLFLVGVAIASYRYAKNRAGTVVLPGGITYLGPSPTPTAAPAVAGAIISVSGDASWSTYKGKLFPYSFSHPSTLSLGVFPNDQFDSVTIFWANTNPQENLLLRVEDLNKLPDQASYINKSKKEYAQNWWKQYHYQGIASITQFTNSQGLTGYRAQYLETGKATTADNIFFEVPGRPELVIWMTSRLLDPVTFNKIVDSVNWEIK